MARLDTPKTNMCNMGKEIIKHIKHLQNQLDLEALGQLRPPHFGEICVARPPDEPQFCLPVAESGSPGGRTTLGQSGYSPLRQNPLEQARKN
jgi:hypothetical protein